MKRPNPILLTGGAGYIGSHVSLALRDAGYPVVVLDDLSTGHRRAVPPGAAFVLGDAGRPATAAGVIREYGVEAVVHLAGSSSAPDSIARPLDYYHNNTVASANLIRACVEAGVRRFLFASSAAVYGAPTLMPVGEDTPPAPAHPYGRSKLATEWMLADAAARHGMKCVSLRYFNVAGADPGGRAGQSSRGAAHILKVACEAAVGTRAGVTVFGADYATADGACVRDYIHVSDLSAIHVAVLQGLEHGHPGGVFNCGAGRGHSVREVIAAVRREAGADFPVREGDRRPGDPPALVADASRLQREFACPPRFDGLGAIVRSALAWERAGARLPPDPDARMTRPSELRSHPGAAASPVAAPPRGPRVNRPGPRRRQSNPPAHKRRDRYQRPFDLAMTSFLLLALFPLWLMLAVAIAAAVRLQDGGSVIYRQPRLGRGGKVFSMLKFRTMAEDAERSTGPVWALPRDARTTAVGRLLRRFHLDELPQVVNVLRGEMSLVGPRPERPELAARIERACPGFARRLAVRPGIAGLAQARGGMGHRGKLRYDLVYIGAMGPWLDLRLGAACIWRALRGSRRPLRHAAARDAALPRQRGAALRSPERSAAPSQVRVRSRPTRSGAGS